MEILVDTSVWIDFFNGIPSHEAKALHHMLQAEDPICISDIILAETLQGFRHDRDFDAARTHLLNFPIYELTSSQGFIQAAQLYRLCRKRGVTIRKTIDCLIAQIAIEHRLVLLHKDSDFDRIASVSPLQIVRV